MRLNSANRSYFAIVATVMVPYGLLGLLSCGVLSLVGIRIAEDGVAGLTREGQDLRPALVFFAVMAVVTVIGARSAHRQMVATRALVSDVAARTIPPTAAVDEAAARAGLADRVSLVDDPVPYSFTFGLADPRVAISTGLVDAVRTDELAAVLHHERFHLRNADTLKMVIARAAVSAFFFLPVLGHLHDRYLGRRELAADRAAVRASGQQALAGALFTVLDGPAWADFGAAAALGGGVLEHRVEQMEVGAEPPTEPIPSRAWWLTVVAFGAFGALFVLTVALAGADVLGMGGSALGGRGGDAFAVVAGVACMAGMAGIVVAALRTGTRRRRIG